MNVVVLRLLVLAACAFVVACSAVSSVDDALARARPHLDTFARFERWVIQARSAELVPGAPGALAEATFAPLRAESSVLAAFVRAHAANGPGLAITMPDKSELPASVPWVAIRNQELGALRVAHFETCPWRARSGKTRPAACTLLEQEISAANGGALTVSVAFSDSL